MTPTVRRCVGMTALLCLVFISTGRVLAQGCPTTPTSVQFVAKGATGRAVMYRALLSLASPAPSTVRFDMNEGRSSSEVGPLAIVRDPSPSVSTGSAWIERPKADLTAITLTAVDGVPCESNPVTVTNPSASTAVVTVYDDAKPRASLPPDISNLSSLWSDRDIVDQGFIKKLQPSYPERALLDGAQGSVSITIDVGSDGKPIDGWVRSMWINTALSELERAAMDAALGSRFVPPQQDGRSTTARYSIVYSFEEDPGGFVAPDGYDHQLCPIDLDDVTLESSSGGGQPSWYSYRVSARTTEFTSAVIDVVDASDVASHLNWSDVQLAEDPIRSKAWNGAAAFDWSGPPIAGAWISSVTSANGKRIPCQPVVVQTGARLHASPYTRVATGDPLPLLDPQPVVPAAFSDEIWPVYPTQTDGNRQAGHVDVEAAVDARGIARDAFVTKSSGVNALDVAAVGAAATSTYQPAPPHQVIIYDMTYRFVP